ncbi:MULTISPECIES: DUF1697 domain-containing protein [unclassified Clostridium]|uniref:DUF1697 domain-containing protein n=1 Tax=unclassified Clostridium TaxID=2614128 RepID=UPI000297D49D|nr:MULTISPECIES: DUF1697 domain-containing protein [unclassified Clostridium]EKQ57484.1 MAG: hypothetical protein A370_00858 [Clostridium sp. Maddingley MBC34-26]
MTIFIALLRGINVGGKNIIKMNDLKSVLESIGLSEVQTYIQSGNVLFKSSEDKGMLIEKIEQEIEKAFGFSVAVILRTSKEIEQIIKNCPFSEKEILEAESSSKAESLYIGILSDAPLEENIKKLDVYKNQNNKYKIIGQEVFLLFHNSIRNSKLANNLHKLDVLVTVRNWKTINKLYTLAKAKEF